MPLHLNSEGENGETAAKPRALVIHSNPALLFSIEAMLDGFQVYVAIDGFNALKHYQTHNANFDVIITALVMPKLDGFTLASRFRKQSKCPIVVLAENLPRIGRESRLFLERLNIVSYVEEKNLVGLRQAVISEIHANMLKYETHPGE